MVRNRIRGPRNTKMATEFVRTCRPCNITCYTTKGWNNHLMGAQHQESAADLFPPSRRYDRAIVGWKFDDSLSTFPEKILNLFVDFGVVENVYFQLAARELPNIVAVHVLMEKREDAEKFLNYWTEEEVLAFNIDLNGGTSKPRPKFDIVEKIEWRDWNRGVEEYAKSLREKLRREKLLKSLAEASTEEQVQVFMSELSCSETDMKIRIRTIENLNRYIRSMYPSCKLYPFGSFVTGLDSADSDIDIYVDLHEDIERLGLSLEDVREDLARKMRYAEANRKRLYKDILYIKNARVPIIRVVDASTKIQLDLSFKSAISLRNSKLMKFFLDFDPLVKPLMMLIKYWATSHGLIDSSKIKSYGLNLLTIVFLNQQWIVPRVGYLQLGVDEEIAVDGGNSWNVAFVDNVASVRKSITMLESKPPNIADLKTILSLAAKFFKFYGSEDLRDKFICTLQGSVVQKELLRSKYRDLFDTYLGVTSVDVSRLSSGTLTIQDPFVLNVNVNNPSWDHVDRFQELCRETFDRLNARLNEHDGPLSLLDVLKDE